MTRTQMATVRNLLSKIIAGATARAWATWREMYQEVLEKQRRLQSGTKRALDKEYQKMCRMFYQWLEETRMEGQVCHRS